VYEVQKARAAELHFEHWKTKKIGDIGKAIYVLAI
jgi:hypothetical protein